jgi:hypothetical protein
MSKAQRKNLEKFPVKRETISSKIEKNIDKAYIQELKIKDKMFEKYKK